MGRASSFDAHDAGGVGEFGVEIVDDAGCVGGSWGRASPVDAHDAGGVTGFGVEIARLILLGSICAML